MLKLSLVGRNNPLASPTRQRDVLEHSGQRPFAESLAESGLWPLRATALEVLQVNVGKLCNQTCGHCHVDAGPDRSEVMSRETMRHCLDLLVRGNFTTLDVTGGAPELNPDFRWLVEQGRALGRHVIDRCNLTILLAPRFEYLPEFLARNRVEIIASLPCYLQQNTDRQRGEGVFEKSIEAIRRLNAVGYGDGKSDLTLTLVYNPVGPSLPPPQQALEADYRRELSSRYGIVFSRLFTITNLPISRFLQDLIESGKYEAYLRKLIDAYNPRAAEGVMCRNTLSVGWDGRLYDCDFNQMLDLALSPGLPRYVWEVQPEALLDRAVVTGQHCYGCTAGAGSGCQGAIT